MPKQLYRLEVKTPRHQYPIYIGEQLIHHAPLWQALILGQQVMLVTNQQLAERYAQQIKSSLADCQFDTLVMVDSEREKHLASVEKIFTALYQQRHHRDTTLIALGGGVIGDMTGFAAACYQRGVRFLQVPTTLLAQVDASVGGKTGVNFAQAKNLIGAFYQPQAVVIDLDTLTSLPQRHFAAGMAEVIKIAMVADADFFLWLEAHMAPLLQRQQTILAEAIYRSCALKAKIVQQDETEQGVRAWLNFGHTFAHALEALTGYQTLLHGEAVAIGLMLATKLSQMLCDLPETVVERTQALLQQANLPTQLPPTIDHQALLATMAMDKKVLRQRQRFILLNALGKACVGEEVAATILHKLFNWQQGEFLCQKPPSF
jgi:3-dehydroquinate synthase